MACIQSPTLTLVVPQGVSVPPELLPGRVQLQKLQGKRCDADIDVLCPRDDGLVAHGPQPRPKHHLYNAVRMWRASRILCLELSDAAELSVPKCVKHTEKGSCDWI